MLGLDTCGAKQGVVCGWITVKASPSRTLFAVRPLVLALRADNFGIDAFRVADLDNLEYRMVYGYEFRVRPRQLVEGATEGAFDSVAFPGVNADQLGEALGTVGVSTSQNAGRGVVLGSVLLVANRALQNLQGL